MHYSLLFPRRCNALHGNVVKFDTQFEKVNAIKGERAKETKKNDAAKKF